MTTITPPNDVDRQKRAIGAAIKFLRRREGLTQRQLADRLGVTINTVSEGERGVRYVGTEMLLNINAALNLEPGEALEVAAEFIRLDALGGTDTVRYRHLPSDLQRRAVSPPVPCANAPPGQRDAFTVR